MNGICLLDAMNLTCLPFLIMALLIGKAKGLLLEHF